MHEPHSAANAMERQFQRHYRIVSILPLLFLFIVVVGLSLVTRTHLTELIVEATHTLNFDAEKSLQQLGEKIIQDKARDVAKQIEIYFRMHPNKSIQEMRADPLFREISLQGVGKTGYTAMYEAITCIFRVHPNPNLIDLDVRFLAKDLPSWWRIVEPTLSGEEVSGYYDWLEPDGTLRKKYMTVTPVGHPLHGTTMMAAATTYIDEFSAPIVVMQRQADTVVEQYGQLMTRQWLAFIVLATALMLVTLAGTHLLGRRVSSHFIRPIVHLSDRVHRFGEGQWEVVADTDVLARKDEIGALGRAFEGMSRQIKDLFGRLEGRLEELKRTQKALEASSAELQTLYEESKRTEQVYRSLIHSSADAIVIYDMQGSATYVSPMFTRIFGWTEEELLGKHIPFLPDSERDATMAIIKDLIEHGTPCQGFETRRFTKDGRLIEVSISASRYADHQGRPAGMLVIIRDISDKKRMETHMQHVERMEAIGTLAGGMAHDFNNLLMVVQGNISLMLHGMDGSHPHHDILVKMEKQVQRGAKLTGQLLGYARKGKYEVKAISFNEIIVETTDAFRRMRKDITVHYDLAGDLRAVEADIYQVEQVLMNLFINAADAMPDGGTLYVSTHNVTSEQMPRGAYTPKPGDYVGLIVRDTGTGMDAKTMERIFDPFFTTKEMGRGTGMGLASVYGIVKGHGGYIDVDSQIGRGTAFSIYLPASTRSVAAPVHPSKQATKGQGTILLVDDEALVLEVGAKMLETLGYTVIQAGGGREALDIYAHGKHRIDLVVLDMVMPDISGSLTFDRIREINPNVPVLLSSGYSIDGKATEIISRGCNGFIQKPFTLEAFAEKIESIL